MSLILIKVGDVMTAVTHALTKINTIPKAVLKYAFGGTQRSFVNQDSLIEQNIIEKVIEGRLRNEIDVMGPTENEILLKNSWKKVIDHSAFLVTLPIEATKNRRMMSVISVTLGRMPRSSITSSMGAGFGTYGSTNGNSLSSQNNKVMTSSAPTEVFSTANVEIIGKNSFIVHSPNRNIQDFLMTALFSTDENFSTIIPQLYHRFAKCALLLTESHIYSNCYLDISRNALSAGKEFSEMREIVSRFEASEEKFEEEMSLFKKAIRVNDPLRKRKHNLMISPR